jgi:hypothetical protein
MHSAVYFNFKHLSLLFCNLHGHHMCNTEVHGSISVLQAKMALITISVLF